MEGYVESIMSGMIAAKSLASELDGKEYAVPSDVTIIGSLCEYISTRALDFKPMNANFGIVRPLDARVKGGKSARNEKLAERALAALAQTHCI